MDSARHIITRILNPRFLNSLASYDVARTVHQSLAGGPAFAPSAPPGPPAHMPPAQEEEDDAEAPAKVGQCRLTPG